MTTLSSPAAQTVAITPTSSTDSDGQSLQCDNFRSTMITPNPCCIHVRFKIYMNMSINFAD